MIRNSKYIVFLQRVHDWWECTKTYIEHIFELIDETIGRNVGISLIRELAPVIVLKYNYCT